MSRFWGVVRVKVPSPSLVTVRRLVVPLIKSVRSTVSRILVELRRKRREAVRPVKVEEPETETVPEALRAVVRLAVPPVCVVKARTPRDVWPVTFKVPEALMLVLAVKLVPVALVKLTRARVVSPVTAKVELALRAPAKVLTPLLLMANRLVDEL